MSDFYLTTAVMDVFKRLTVLGPQIEKFVSIVGSAGLSLGILRLIWISRRATRRREKDHVGYIDQGFSLPNLNQQRHLKLLRRIKGRTLFSHLVTFPVHLIKHQMENKRETDPEQTNNMTRPNATFLSSPLLYGSTVVFSRGPFGIEEEARTRPPAIDGLLDPKAGAV